MRILGILLAFVGLTFGAPDVQRDISQNTKKLEETIKAQSKISQKLDKLGRAINQKNQEIINLDAQIENLQKGIEQNKSKYSLQEKSLKDNQTRQNELIEKSKKLQSEVISLVSKSLAFYALSNEIDSKEDVLSQEVLNILLKDSKKRIKTLKENQEKLNNEINNVSKNISTLKDSIQAQSVKKLSLEETKAKQEQIIASMKKELNAYNAELQAINNERKNLDSILSNLKIIQAQNEKNIQKQVQKDEQAQANLPNPKRTIQPSKDVRIASSAYKDIKTAVYKGSKTIPPLEPKTFSIDQKFGPTFDPVYKMKFFYENIILVPKNKNASVKSVLDGKVVFAKENPVIKKVVIIEHSNSLYTVYAHLDKISNGVKNGVYVKKGFVIGNVNEKLSFEVTQKDKHIDPLQLIKIN
ncbi:murein hydrolase activator EnvC family protein [Helicobacter sp. 23-1048]